MKILQVINAFYPPYSSGGAAYVAHNISKILARRGHEVTVYTTNVLSRNKLFNPKQNPNYISGVEVYYFNVIFYKPSFQVYFSKELVEAIRKNAVNYDVVHLHEYRSYISLVTNHYLRKRGIPYVLQAHGQLPRIMVKRGLKIVFDVFFGYRILHEASKVIALTRVEAEQYKSMGVPEEKIAIIPNGIDLSEYTDLPPKGAFKRKFNIPEGKKIILYLGRIHKTKGIEFLIKAYAYLINEMNFREAVLVIAGPDDGYLSEVKQLVDSLEAANKVMFTGMLSEKEKISAYVDSTIVVNVEPKNVFGLVPLEAAACSTPVIVSRGNAISDVVNEGKFGFSIKYGNVNKLAEIISEVLTDDNLLKEMGQNGRKFVFENYDWANSVSKLERVYEEVMHDKNNDTYRC